MCSDGSFCTFQSEKQFSTKNEAKESAAKLAVLSL
jgi:hypothetical protein